MSREREKGIIQADIVALIDVDRTILNTDTVFALVVDTLQQMGVDKQTIKIVAQTNEQTKGQAFDYLAEVKKLSPDIAIEPTAIVEKICKQHKQDALTNAVLASGAVELINALKDIQAHTVLVTAGGEVTQKTKLLLLEALFSKMADETLLPPWVIVDSSKQHKTQLAEDAYDVHAKSFSLDTLLSHALASSGEKGVVAGAEQVIVIDDKTSNVARVGTERIMGILVQPAEVYETLADASERRTLQEVATMIRTLSL